MEEDKNRIGHTPINRSLVFMQNLSQNSKFRPKEKKKKSLPKVRTSIVAFPRSLKTWGEIVNKGKADINKHPPLY